ncbi:MAG: menaquinone biosynthesis protein [Bacteroidales bacterium]|nr:menaquinone biosynthesis protein [Bacteroidales bacterium]MBN2758513.1 menaquinone biosynthesis protein [Bacteroidales bacterium]
MTKEKIKISAVSYLNTLPFLYGIKNSNLSENIIFEQDMPSVCAKKLINNEVDIALIPVAAIPFLNNSQIISDYCIGAEGKVKTVLLLSEVPLKEIKSIYLDYQSRTSVNLIRILANKYWLINPTWETTTKGYETEIKGNKAGLIIGDRTFHLIKKYKYIYDLAEEWKKYTNLPFVFAAWVSNKHINKEFISEFNNALKYGIENINKVAEEFYNSFPENKIDLKEYFTENISYKLNEEKKQALNFFLNELDEIGIFSGEKIEKIPIK